MTAITVTAADVRPLSGALVRRVTAGSAVNIGEPVFMASDGYVDPADGSAVSSTLSTMGLAVATPDGGTSVAAGEVLDVVTHGPVAGFSSLTPGGLVFVSDTAGGLDTATGTKGLVVGFAESATVVFVRPAIVSFS